MIALGFKLFGFTEFGARFFPSLYGLLGLYLVTWGGRKLYGEKVGFFSGVFLLMTLQFFTISKSVLTDGMLFLFLNGALLFTTWAIARRRKSITTGCMSAQP